MATIQGVYVALFGRPADPTGLAYFNSITNNGQNLAAIANLAGSAEYQQRFAGQTNVQIVNSIYRSLFNRDADVAGLNFFVAGLNNGTFKINDIAIRILDGAQGSDRTIVDTKIAAANAFTAALDTTPEIVAYNGNAAAEQGRAFLAPISTTAPTAAQVDAAVAAIVANPGGGGLNLALTNSTDALVGSGANDTFVAGTQAGFATLTAGDSINGGEGTDVLRIFGNTNAAAFAGSTITSVENVEVQLAAGGATALNVSNNAGVKEVTLIAGSSGASTITLTKAQTAGIQGNSNPAGAGDNITFLFSNASAAANDVANLKVNGGNVDSVIVADIETLNVAATGSNSLGTLTATSATTLNLTGTGSVSATTGTGALKTIDGSALAGGFNLNIAAATATDLAVKGSAANDTLTTVYASLSNADSIDLGAGTGDTLLFTDAATFNTAATAGRLSKVVGVEEIGTVGVALTVDGDLVSQTRFSTSGVGSITATNVAQNSTLEFGAGAAAASTAALKLGANTVNVALEGSATAAADVSAGLAVTGSSTINVLSTGTAGVANNVLALTVAGNQSVVLTGSQNTTLSVATAGATGVSIDGSAFTGNGTLTGSAQADIVKGGTGADIISGGALGDTLTGGAGADTFVYTTLTDSVAATPDRITDFTAGTDKFDVATVPTTVFQGAAFTAAGTGTLATDIASALAAGGQGAIAANNVALVTITGTGAGTYLVINNGTAGYAAADDAVINVTGLTGSLTTADFI